MLTPQLESFDVAHISRRIEAAKTIVLTTHKQCDGDGLGAVLALKQGLESRGKQVRAIMVDAIPKKYAFLHPERSTEIFSESTHGSSIEPHDLAIVIDTNDRRLVEPLYFTLEKTAREILFVDHHPVLKEGPEPTPGSFIETRAASTGEIAYFILRELGIELDETIARALYTSISFDTQVFKFVKNSVNSHLIAAEMLTLVPNAEDIHRHMFATHTVGKVAFLSQVLGEVEYYGHEQIAVLKLSDKTLTAHGLDIDDSRDVIDMLMHVNSLQAAALLREDAPGEYKLSMRSKGQIEVLSIAEALGGGGHKFAAGATVYGDFAKIKKDVVERLLQKVPGT